jgi:hypothetical protein
MQDVKPADISRIKRGKKRHEVGGNCRMRNLINSYCSPSIIGMIKSRKMRWARHVASMGEKTNA